MEIHRNKFNIGSVGLGLLICIFIFLIGLGISAWHEMTKSGNESNAVQVVSSFRLKQNKYASQHFGQFAAFFTKFDEFKKVCATPECEKIIVDEYIFNLVCNLKLNVPKS